MVTNMICYVASLTGISGFRVRLSVRHGDVDISMLISHLMLHLYCQMRNEHDSICSLDMSLVGVKPPLMTHG